MTDICGLIFSIRGLKTFHSVVAVGQLYVDILVLRLRVLQIIGYNSSENAVCVIICTQNIFNATHLRRYTMGQNIRTGWSTAALFLPVLRPTPTKIERLI